MKWVWIALGVLFLLGALSCGGIFFLGRRELSRSGARYAQAKEYSRASVTEMFRNWAPEAYINRAITKEAPAQVETFFKLHQDAYGPLLSLRDASSDSSAWRSENTGTPQVPVTFVAHFTKQDANVHLWVSKFRGEWKILRLEFSPRIPGLPSRIEELKR